MRNKKWRKKREKKKRRDPSSCLFSFPFSHLHPNPSKSLVYSWVFFQYLNCPSVSWREWKRDSGSSLLGNLERERDADSGVEVSDFVWKREKRMSLNTKVSETLFRWLESRGWGWKVVKVWEKCIFYRLWPNCSSETRKAVVRKQKERKESFLLNNMPFLC